MSTTHAELLMEYLKFCDLRSLDNYPDSVELPSSPTALLPLTDLFRRSFSLTKQRKLFDPAITIIPTDKNQSNNIYSKIIANNSAKNYGGENVFSYIIAEWTDNVYEHSNFTYGSVLGKENASIGFSELAIYDDGITIQGSFENNGMIFQGSEVIVNAINGISSKQNSERGHGLPSTFKLIICGLKGQLSIVSGHGAIFSDPYKKILYNVTSKNYLEGTLVSARIPYPSPQIEIYDYL